MRLLTWNIQYGKGCDGVTDLARIVSVAKSFADADVFCFQEVSANFPKLDKGTDQSVALAALLPDYRPIFGPAIETVDNEGRAHRFGNMTLSRLPVLQIASHLLPWPRTGVPRSVRRMALDVTVEAAFGPVRIVNTTRISFGDPTRGADRAAIGLAGRSLDQSVGRECRSCRAICQSDAGCFQHPLRGFQFRRAGYPASSAAHFTATGIELSRRLGDLPTGTAAPAHVRHLRSRAMAGWPRLPRFCLRNRRSRKPRAPDRGEPGDLGLGPSARADRTRRLVLGAGQWSVAFTRMWSRMICQD